MRYLINSPHVIADIIDGELIILNMETGKYFSIKGSGTVIWQLLAGGYEEQEAAETLTQHYKADHELLLTAITKLKNQFIEDNLLKPLDEFVTRPTVDIKLEAGGRAFEEPVVEGYTDMQGLLLLDPIHEVEDMGWPHKSD